MNKSNNFWPFVLVITIILWSVYQVLPPTSRDLIGEFASRSQKHDTNFTAIVTTAQAYQKAGTNNEFVALTLAAGTNDLLQYFPWMTAATQQVNPNLYILNRIQREAAGKIKLGLDLQGGTSFLVRMDTSKLANTNETGAAISQAIEVLRKRIDRFGVAEPTFQSAGGDRILIQLPGLSEAVKDSALRQITNSAYLEFRLVHENSDEIIRTGEPIPPGYTLLKHVQHLPGNKNQLEEFVVKKTAENKLAGDIIKDAQVVRGNLGEPQINFTLTTDAAHRFGDVTRENIGRQLAIILDGDLCTAPRIESAIEGGSGQITGNYTIDEAQAIANVLQNPLKAPLVVESSSEVGATLGQDSIRSGVKASIYGVFFVSLFMLGYYWLAGIAANVALITNIVILLGVMCSVGTTFTLPGIAGGVLTVGMAVDANVLIYERIREELAKGKSLRGAIAAGYDRAFGTIFDSHVTTLISSVILIFMGTGEIKGFGVTLTIGVAASLFTALVVTRLIFNFLLDRNLIKSLPMAHIIKSAHVNFMGAAKPLFIITWLFVILSLGFGVSRGTKLFGVDFLGGDSTQFSFAQKYDEQDIRNVLTPLGEKDATIQYQKGNQAETLLVTTSGGSSAKVEAALEAGLPKAQYQVVQRRQIGATLGREIQQSAIVASLLALFGILVYVAFRYEFSFAVAAIVAVVHDVLFAIGAYCIANAVTGRQFNATVVAAILTIIGFSINDKIVIFDRIREQLKLGVRGSFSEIINMSLNQTLSRTIITSGTVLIATASLYFFGGGVINDFAFTFLVGIVVGTYSSIYIASVFVLWWHKGERPNIGSPVTTPNVVAPPVPVVKA